LTGGRRLRSGLYRVSYTGAESVDLVDVDGVSVTQRVLERVQSSMGVNEVWKSLGSDDRMLRYAARVSLEQILTEGWVKRYESEVDRQTLITVSLALFPDELRDLVLFLTDE